MASLISSYSIRSHDMFWGVFLKRPKILIQVLAISACASASGCGNKTEVVDNLDAAGGAPVSVSSVVSSTDQQPKNKTVACAKGTFLYSAHEQSVFNFYYDAGIAVRYLKIKDEDSFWTHLEIPTQEIVRWTSFDPNASPLGQIFLWDKGLGILGRTGKYLDVGFDGKIRGNFDEQFTELSAAPFLLGEENRHGLSIAYLLSGDRMAAVLPQGIMKIIDFPSSKLVGEPQEVFLDETDEVRVVATSAIAIPGGGSSFIDHSGVYEFVFPGKAEIRTNISDSIKLSEKSGEIQFIIQLPNQTLNVSGVSFFEIESGRDKSKTGLSVNVISRAQRTTAWVETFQGGRSSIIFVSPRYKGLLELMQTKFGTTTHKILYEDPTSSVLLLQAQMKQPDQSIGVVGSEEDGKWQTRTFCQD